MAVLLARRGAAALLALVALSAPVLAEELTFVMNNQHPKPVEVQLYSQNRESLWPGPSDVFLLEDGETRTMTLACETGETICYGAWLQGDRTTFWGVGPGKVRHCDNCCYVCQGGKTEEIDLVP
ncbi:hypothetical protein SAZ10_25785 [Mesorhizobium sp. BAC0120]|uniref:hypothetical protein n=1 Tax=Mesorhizobium sp. BAC0120 TaxID=3090670 RepID=UPI00298C31EC|nr:hypothetical protein [Mesorhizobium sp. BAC0120]MDW6025175.1 hypothetical protein [Mesorhizobium sp. BAC0120]